MLPWHHHGGSCAFSRSMITYTKEKDRFYLSKVKYIMPLSIPTKKTDMINAAYLHHQTLLALWIVNILFKMTNISAVYFTKN